MPTLVIGHMNHVLYLLTVGLSTSHS